MPDAYAQLIERLKEIGRIEAIQELLDWDQETQMPPKGVGPRAETVAMVAALAHDRWLDPKLSELLEQAGDGHDPIQSTNIREARRLHARATRVPTDLVRKTAHASSMAKDAWAKARQASDFAAFAPQLGELLELRRQAAEHIGYEGEPYDALVDEFEPAMKTSEIATLFAELRQLLAPIVKELVEAPKQPDFSILQRDYPQPAQEAMARRFSTEMGFDWQAGRMDTSVHPFCMSLAPTDVRFTTRYHDDYLPAAIFGVMHETGHGLYEQGLDVEHAFTPAGRYISLGIHESQSRLWENQVGRSRPFWERHFAWAQTQFPEALSDVTLDQFYAAINRVSPSLIRVEADEVTYSLHIVVRFEIERALLNRELDVADIPEAWNTRMTDLVGITPPNDRQGCLQDVHWSMGAFGYFPTYALGNLYAAQFFAAARRAIPDLDDRIRAGELGVLLEWLRTNIHRHGMRYRAKELCELVTGQPVSSKAFVEYVSRKYRPIYGLA